LGGEFISLIKVMNKSDFSEETVDPNPYVQFRNWYDEHQTEGTAIPDSVSLGTAWSDGRISVRTVLLKGFNEKGFVFFTNYESRKGSQLTSNPWAALLFYWPESARQVRIEGLTEKISEEDSAAYFLTRPRDSQLSARASRQSSVIPDRKHLEKNYLTEKTKYSEKPVEKPGYWGGYRLTPVWFEFWQEGEFRLHDRLTYIKKDNIWIIERLAP
jgi:pyridoxamine 5'-phosphate oxidase